MYQTSVSATEPVDQGPGGVRVRSLLTGDAGPTHGGCVSITELAPGAEVAVHRHGNVEEASVVLDGEIVLLTAEGERRAPEGTVIFAPSGTWHGMRASDGPARLFTAHAGVNDPAALDVEEAAGGLSGPAPKTIRLADAPDNRFHDPGMGFHNLNARWLVTGDALGSTRLVLGANAFDPETGLHELHRHPGAEEFLYIVEGEGESLGEDGAIPTVAGDIALMAKGEWHGFRNAGSQGVRGLFGYFGANSLEAGGYELPDRR